MPRPRRSAHYRKIKVSHPIDTVTRVLNHQPVDLIPKGELFINKSFLDHYFGKFKGEYVLQLQTAVAIFRPFFDRG